jgi:hypothetical protein
MKPGLTEEELDVLHEAERILHRPDQAKCYLFKNYPGYFACMDIGGGNRSHHSKTLKKLTKKGLVETPRGNPRSRANKRYKITQAGIDAHQSACTHNHDDHYFYGQPQDEAFWEAARKRFRELRPSGVE